MTLHSDDPRDAALGALLAEPPLASDPRFAAQVIALVDADRRFAAARRAAWQRFAVEAVATVAVALALLVLAQLSGGGGALPAAPAVAGVLAVLAWLGAGQGARAFA